MIAVHTQCLELENRRELVQTFHLAAALVPEAATVRGRASQRRYRSETDAGSEKTDPDRQMNAGRDRIREWA